MADRSRATALAIVGIVEGVGEFCFYFEVLEPISKMWSYSSEYGIVTAQLLTK